MGDPAAVKLIHLAYTVDKTGLKRFFLDAAARAQLPPDIVERLVDANHPARSRRTAPADLEFRWTPTRHAAIRVIGSSSPATEDRERIPSTGVDRGADGVPFLFADHARHKDGTPDKRDLARLKAVQDAYAKEQA